MHGLINRALQTFISDTFGLAAWAEIQQRAGITPLLGPEGFEAMQLYDDSLTDAVLAAAWSAGLSNSARPSPSWARR